MLNRNTKLLVLVTGVILFDYFFWLNNLGLNILLMNVFVNLVILVQYPLVIRSKETLFTMLGSFATAVAIVIHSSSFTIIMHFISLVVMLGFVHQQSLKSIVYAIPTSLGNYLMLPDRVVLYFKSAKDSSTKMRSFLRFTQLLVIPVILLIVFYLLFTTGNLIFADLTNKLFATIGNWIYQLFEHFSFYRILFVLLGAVLIGGLIYNNNLTMFRETEATLAEYIFRKKGPLKRPLAAKKLSMGLKNEIRSAIILMILINIMLLVVNGIDIANIWIGFTYTTKFDLKHFVHEGTYMLIASILLSMAVMLVYFRKNVNFYPNNTLLKYLAYAWIVQNVILLISVVIRNYHYMHYFGLAYKRIGVIIFLILVLFGLYTLFIKIRKKKSDYYLFRTNSWSMYLVLICFSLFSWDMIIAKHNLAHPLKNNMETCFLLVLSDKVLPEIDKHKYVLDQKPSPDGYMNFAPLTFSQVYEQRVIAFLKRKEKESWQSWNWAEDEAYKYFKGKEKASN